MFILRRITDKGLEANTCLGIEYVLVIKERDKEEFKERTKLWGKEDLEGVYGVIAFNDGANLMPLYNDSNYYIMASDGKTFDNVSIKAYNS